MKNAMNFRPVGLMLLFCLIPLWAFAQSVMVKGVVKDTSGEAIIGASVLEKGTTNGTITDFDGNEKRRVGGEFCRLQERGNPGSGKEFFKDYIEGRFQSFGRSGGDWLR